ncbi:hypothetical protein [Caudoviricetes sp.]|nr:hypothetical protein [Caudoviricetes sp.]
MKHGQVGIGNGQWRNLTALEMSEGARHLESHKTYRTALRRLRDVEQGDMSDWGLYNALAGEVEARVVQKRMGMTPDQRAARPPWLDYDVPETQQIVRDD